MNRRRKREWRDARAHLLTFLDTDDLTPCEVDEDEDKLCKAAVAYAESLGWTPPEGEGR